MGVAEDPAERARDSAVRMLARREHARAELTRKLVAKGVAEPLASEVVARLAAQKLVCDERFTEMLVHARIERGHGPRRIAHELRERGVDETLIEAAVDAADRDWIRRAAGARAKRFGAAAPGSYAERARQTRFLQQRGFTGEQIRRALDAAAGVADDD